MLFATAKSRLIRYCSSEGRKMRKGVVSDRPISCINSIFSAASMKYYLPRPLFGYFLLSIIGSGVLGGIVIAACSISDIDVPDETRSYILLAGFCVSALCFALRAYYKRNRRDYVELGHGYIEWCQYKRKETEITRINVSDIRLFEIAYYEGQHQPIFYDVYGPASDVTGTWGLELFTIPKQSILEWCSTHGIHPLTTTIKATDIVDVKASKKGIKIRYEARFPVFRGRLKKIPFRDIQRISFVSPHRISKTEDHYVVTTHEGKSYSFSPRIVNEKVLLQAATYNDIQILRHGSEI